MNLPHNLPLILVMKLMDGDVFRQGFVTHV